MPLANLFPVCIAGESHCPPRGKLALAIYRITSLLLNNLIDIDRKNIDVLPWIFRYCILDYDLYYWYEI